MFAAEDHELAQAWTNALNKTSAFRRPDNTPNHKHGSRPSGPNGSNAAAKGGGHGDTPVPTRANANTNANANVNASASASTTLSTHNILERRRKASYNKQKLQGLDMPPPTEQDQQPQPSSHGSKRARSHLHKPTHAHGSPLANSPAVASTEFYAQLWGAGEDTLSNLPPIPSPRSLMGRPGSGVGGVGMGRPRSNRSIMRELEEAADASSELYKSVKPVTSTTSFFSPAYTHTYSIHPNNQ